MDDKLKGFIHSVVLFNNCEKYSDEEKVLEEMLKMMY